MHSIDSENVELITSAGTFNNSSTFDHQNLITCVSLKRKYVNDAYTTVDHSQAKSFKRTVVPLCHSNTDNSNNQMIKDHMQIIQCNSDTNNELSHQINNGGDQMDYVNVMFDNNLLPVQNTIIMEPNYINYNDELNSTNWSNVDLLDLDQKNLFFQTNNNDDKDCRDDGQQQSETMNAVPSKKLPCMILPTV